MKRLQDMTESELGGLLDAMGVAILGVAAEMGVEKPLFALLLFNDPKLGQYVSNCRREDVILAFEEAAGRLRRREDVPR